jgi:hypothetical protein
MGRVAAQQTRQNHNQKPQHQKDMMPPQSLVNDMHKGHTGEERLDYIQERPSRQIMAQVRFPLPNQTQNNAGDII